MPARGERWSDLPPPRGQRKKKREASPLVEGERRPSTDANHARFGRLPGKKKDSGGDFLPEAKKKGAEPCGFFRHLTS